MMTNNVFTQEMEETHRLAEVVMVMVIVTMTLGVDHIAGHRVGITMNQAVVNHDEVEIQVQVQMEVTQAVADENGVKVIKVKHGT